MVDSSKMCSHMTNFLYGFAETRPLSPTLKYSEVFLICNFPLLVQFPHNLLNN